MTETSVLEHGLDFKPGALVRARGREWVVLPETRENLLKLRPLGGAEDDFTLLYLPLEPEVPVPATFAPPDPNKPGSHESALLLRDALRMKLRSGAGPFRSFGNLNFEPRAYQLAPLLMALKLDTVRLLIADDVGVGKTIEAGLIVRELLDRGEIDRIAVICPPHLCDQWQQELFEKFAIDTEVVRTGTATRLERGLRPDESVFEAYPFTIVSLDYIKSDRRRNDFLRACPSFVVVDEAHTCVQSNTNTRHQRYQLLKGLVDSDSNRGMLFLTATPHSGDDVAFHNLLGLLNPKFEDLLLLPDGDERRRMREDLALHFVQRRRGDIDEWEGDGERSFPVRESRESTYRLTGDWGHLFDDVLAYARTMVQSAESGTKLEQRMSWWAALALLRCGSSSPAAASLALRTRLAVAQGESPKTQIEALDVTASETVMDGLEDGLFSISESVPAGVLEHTEDTEALRELINRADSLRGTRQDTKLRTLINEVELLLNQEFYPVVFCRYIATAEYIGEELRRTLSTKAIRVEVVTGQLTPEQRKERIEEFGEDQNGSARVLVATDCLSEGVNLQNYFNAVVHYDLTWNPTRHEQREGRADRFGQQSPKVQTLMLYGENNPVDGAVLRVILRKAEKIRQELGVSVPLPTDNNKVVDTIMKSVLLHDRSHSLARQTSIDFSDAESAVDRVWQTAKDKITRTVFAQRRLNPSDVLPEWRKAVSTFGGNDEVERFVRVSAERLGAPLDQHDGYWSLPVSHFPNPFQDRLEAIGFTKAVKITFNQPIYPGAIHIHRTHALVAALADYVTEQALDEETGTVGARCFAMFTKGVEKRTVVYLMRLRSQIEIERRDNDGKYALVKSILAEECLAISVLGTEDPRILTDSESLALCSLEPFRNMPDGQKSHLIRQALCALSSLSDDLHHIARDQAATLLADHRRVRQASEAKGLRYNVVPSLPMDTMAVHVFMPVSGS